MVIGDFGKLSFEKQHEFILELKRSENFYSYSIFTECEDFSAEDIRRIIAGDIVCQRKEARQKIIDIVKLAILDDIYDKTEDKWLLEDEVNRIFKSAELNKYISGKADIIGKYLVSVEYNEYRKDYFVGRTVCINNLALKGLTEEKLSEIPRSVRWYKLSDEDILDEMENFGSILLFDDISFEKGYHLAYLNEDKLSENAVLDIRDTDENTIRSLMEKYGLSELRELNDDDLK